MESRVPGPERTVRPQVAGAAEQPRVVLTTDGRRADGRGPLDARKLVIQPGAVSRARGSAYIEVGNTKVTAACYGPRDGGRSGEFSALGSVECEFKFAPFACAKRRGHVPDDEEREISRNIVDMLASAICLERYPKLVIELYITVLEDDGAALAAAIMACSTALADAGIEQRDLVAASTVALVGSADDLIIVDPTSGEETLQIATMTVATLSSLGEITGLVQAGRTTSAAHADAALHCCSFWHQAQQNVLVNAARAATRTV